MNTHNFDTLHTELHEIRQDIKSLRREVNHYKSFMSGVLWTFAAISAATGFVFSWFQKGV